MLLHLSVQGSCRSVVIEIQTRMYTLNVFRAKRTISSYLYVKALFVHMCSAAILNVQGGQWPGHTAPSTALKSYGIRNVPQIIQHLIDIQWSRNVPKPLKALYIYKG